jgi:hypothetical protein
MQTNFLLLDTPMSLSGLNSLLKSLHQLGQTSAAFHKLLDDLKKILVATDRKPSLLGNIQLVNHTANSTNETMKAETNQDLKELGSHVDTQHSRNVFESSPTFQPKLSFQKDFRFSVEDERYDKLHSGTHDVPESPVKKRQWSNCNCSPDRYHWFWTHSVPLLSARFMTVEHQQWCPVRQKSKEMSWSLGLFVPIITVGKALQVYLQGSSRSFGFQMGRSIKTRSVVDLTRSPAFRLLLVDFAVYDPRANVFIFSECTLEDYRFRVEKIEENLRYYFQKGLASPRDVNYFGETLLNVSTLQYP